MPEPDPCPSSEDTSILTTDGSTCWATASTDPTAAAGASALALDVGRSSASTAGARSGASSAS